MPALALSRVGTHVVESSPGGQDLAAGAWHVGTRERYGVAGSGGSALGLSM